MTAIEALRELGILQFDTKSKFDLTIDGTLTSERLTKGKAIKLYQAEDGDIFGFVGINLPTMISSKGEARISVHIGHRHQQMIKDMASQLVGYPYAGLDGAFDYCLHAGLEVGRDKSVTLIETKNWDLLPSMQFSIKPISSNGNSSVRSKGNGVSMSFNNPKHLVSYFLGDTRFGFGVNLEEESYHLGKGEYYTFNDLFNGIAKTSKFLEVGARPHIPTITGRTRQLADVMNKHQAETVSEQDILSIIDFYNAQKSLSHDTVIVAANDEEGW